MSAPADPASGVAPRPATDPEILAILVAAVDQAWPRPVVTAAPAPAPSNWRFSGRWWATPLPLRRDRPGARR